MKNSTQEYNPTVLIEDDRTGISTETLRRAILDNLFYIQAKFPEFATQNDYYMALAHSIRDRIVHHWIRTLETIISREVKIVCYLSAEYLPGPHLANHIINLDLYEPVRRAINAIGQDLEALIEQEHEPGLGNGGLGRLAACYMDSLATMQIPSIGFGIRYEHGIFHQEINGGDQVETTDNWLHLGNPWEIRRPEVQFHVKLGGHTEHYHDSDDRLRVRWIPHRIVKGVPYDTPISGYKVNTCNTLRLWKAEACEGFDFSAFNKGDYYGAVDEKVASENLTKVLYPNDEPIAGKRLRLEQQYFFVSCSLQNIVYLHSRFADSFDNFHDVWAVQLNDTHPAVAIPELMRLLVDEQLMEWEKAWDIVQKTMAYTNHTLLSEALETWPLNLFVDVLPRHMEIIYEINHRFLYQVRSRYPGDDGRLFRMSLIDETGEKYVRMANLACVGSHAVNGVATLHTKLLKQTVLRDFYEMTPEKFNNKTNGVTPRRFMVLSNPGLSKLITGRIGDAWIKDLSALRRIEGFADDGEFQDEWRRIKRQAKQRLAGLIQEKTGISVNVDSLFDIHVKRIHEYKRQHLKVLHIITLYNRLKNNPEAELAPRTFIFGGKAAPGYFMAKLIIRLINSVADVVNQDPDIRDRLKVVFLPDFSVKVGQRVYPGADLSEQISTAGKEASGTGNMKFSMNGALTVGTLDGANIEIREEVGPENFFLFGLTEDQVIELKSSGYNPMERYQSNPQLRDAIDRIASGFFSKGNANLFKPLIDRLLYHDDYLLFADYPSYIDCQEKIGQTFKNQEKWTRMSILNVARIGKFSSDRSIMEYCNEIWNVKPIPIYLDDPVHTEVKKKTKKP